MLSSTPRQLSSVRNTGGTALFRTWVLGVGGVADWPALQEGRGLVNTSSKAGGTMTGTNEDGVLTAPPFPRDLLHSLQVMARSLESQGASGLEAADCAGKALHAQSSAAEFLKRNWPNTIGSQSVLDAPAEFVQKRGLPSALVPRSHGPLIPSTSCTLPHHHSFATSAPQPSSGDRSADSADGDSSPSSSGSSWFGRMKGMLGIGKQNEVKQEEAFTLERFESQIKQARRFAGVGQLMGRAQSVEARAMLRLFENAEKILGAMSSEEKQDPGKLTAARKASLAESVGLTPKDVDDMMTQYDVARQTFDRLAQMKREGKPIPKTIEEMQKFAAQNMGTLPRPGVPRPAAQSAQPAPKAARVPRNSLCPCGSRKKYKRCCGRDDPTLRAA